MISPVALISATRPESSLLLNKNTGSVRKSIALRSLNNFVCWLNNPLQCHLLLRYQYPNFYWAHPLHTSHKEEHTLHRSSPEPALHMSAQFLELIFIHVRGAAHFEFQKIPSGPHLTVRINRKTLVQI